MLKFQFYATEQRSLPSWDHRGAAADGDAAAVAGVTADDDGQIVSSSIFKELCGAGAGAAAAAIALPPEMGSTAAAAALLRNGRTEAERMDAAYALGQLSSGSGQVAAAEAPAAAGRISQFDPELLVREQLQLNWLSKGTPSIDSPLPHDAPFGPFLARSVSKPLATSCIVSTVAVSPDLSVAIIWTVKFAPLSSAVNWAKILPDAELMNQSAGAPESEYAMSVISPELTDVFKGSSANGTILKVWPTATTVLPLISRE